MATTTEWFRSAEMDYVSIVMQEHCAHRLLARIGRLGAAQFSDLNEHMTPAQRTFTHQIRRCVEVEQKLAFLDKMLIKYKVVNPYSYDANMFLDKIEQKHAMTGLSGVGGSMEKAKSSLLEDLEVLVESKTREVQELNNFRSNLLQEYFYQKELKSVLEKSREFLGGGEYVVQGATGAKISEDEELGAGGKKAARDGLRFQFLTGTISREERGRFERIVFRTTRGNCLMKFSDIEASEDDKKDVIGRAEKATDGNVEDEDLQKSVFIVFYQAETVEQKIRRICEAFSATLYQIPELENTASFDLEFGKVQQEIIDRERVLSKNYVDIEANLNDLCKWIDVWRWSAAREKSIYHTLNKFASDVKGVLRAEAWVLAASKEEVQQVVYEVHQLSGGAKGGSKNLPSSVTTVPIAMRPRGHPPTYFKTNKFTSAFQIFVDTYGVPRYGEANPALFTVITFPFLFGVMFGDIGHGLLLFLFACLIVWKEDTISKMKLDEISAMIFGGRYFLILMGFFAVYAGILYNDYFAMGLRLFEPRFQINNTQYAIGDVVLYVPINGSSPYPLGVDPTWHHAENGLVFFNSLKMKMAVIFGVTHMTFGLCLKLSNTIHFKSMLDLFGETIPQFIFLLGLFGYMCALIIYKWSTPWRPFCDPADRNCEPPSIISTLINMVLSVGTVEYQNQFYEGQDTVQLVLLLLALVAVPWMLCVKPCVLGRAMKSHRTDRIVEGNGHGHEKEQLLSGSNAARSTADVDLHTVAHEEEHSVGDLWIHQGIETIEFCLGGISNTASYLRLWALSLAHSQLGMVFLSNTLLNFVTIDGPGGVIMAFLGYGAFAGVTFGVLLVMDNLECFLHSLRLHWVEFQSKFYKADGVLFEPLDFENVLKSIKTEDEA